MHSPDACLQCMITIHPLKAPALDHLHCREELQRIREKNCNRHQQADKSRQKLLRQHAGDRLVGVDDAVERNVPCQPEGHVQRRDAHKRPAEQRGEPLSPLQRVLDGENQANALEGRHGVAQAHRPPPRRGDRHHLAVGSVQHDRTGRIPVDHEKRERRGGGREDRRRHKRLHRRQESRKGRDGDNEDDPHTHGKVQHTRQHPCCKLIVDATEAELRDDDEHVNNVLACPAEGGTGDVPVRRHLCALQLLLAPHKQHHAVHAHASEKHDDHRPCDEPAFPVRTSQREHRCSNVAFEDVKRRFGCRNLAVCAAGCRRPLRTLARRSHRAPRLRGPQDIGVVFVDGLDDDVVVAEHWRVVVLVDARHKRHQRHVDVSKAASVVGVLDRRRGPGRVCQGGQSLCRDRGFRRCCRHLLGWRLAVLHLCEQHPTTPPPPYLNEVQIL
eukprot:Rhum_TRINITY_DN85_c0_g1::Rhum_TRINITY_DN85_c0_g1_i1::g.223::m.223